MKKAFPLCVDCKYYQLGVSEALDVCTHDDATRGGVRKLHYMTCNAMRAGICLDGRLFEVSNEPRPALEGN